MLRQLKQENQKLRVSLSNLKRKEKTGAISVTEHLPCMPTTLRSRLIPQRNGGRERDRDREKAGQGDDELSLGILVFQKTRTCFIDYEHMSGKAAELTQRHFY